MEFEGIRKAALAIAYDNGMINRLEPEGEFILKLEALLKLPEFAGDAVIINAWLESLSPENLETLCNGEHEESMKISVGGPASTETLLNSIFEL